MSRKAHADFQNWLPYNELERNRIFSVWGFVTHDWRDVGDPLRSRGGEIFAQIPSATKTQILFFDGLGIGDKAGYKNYDAR